MKKVITFLSIIALISCSEKKDFSKVKTGMTEAQVVQAVGEPDQKMPMMPGITHWRYNDKEKHIVVFENDTVSNVADQQKLTEAMDEAGKALDSLKSATDSAAQK